MDRGLPEVQPLDAVIIGAGMGGLGAAAKLKEKGLERIAILERSEGVGGVWRHNRYPNVACDTPIDLYAFSFHLGTKWTRNFASGDEILSYFQDFSSFNGLDKIITFNTDIRQARWDADGEVWRIESAEGRKWTSRFLIWAGGLLSNPAVPTLEGMDHFEGEMLHTANWNEDVNLDGKRVAVIGSGASAIQVVPYAAEHAKHTFSFVRTPSYVLPRPDVIYSDEERADPNLFVERQTKRRREWLERFEFIVKARFPMNLDVINEQEAEWKKNFEKIVKDPELREILIPKYRFGCKRPLFSNDYYPAMVRPNVTVVGDGVRTVYSNGVIDSRGNKYPVDAIIWATGYDPSHMMGTLDVLGEGGRHLADQWRDIPSAYYGTLVEGFPNLFLIGGPNVGGASQSDFIEAQFWLIGEAMSLSDAQGGKPVRVEAQASDSFNADIQARARDSVLMRGNCVSWYLSGKTGGVFTHWPGTIQDFQSRIRNEALDGLTFGHSPNPETVTADELS